MGKKITYVYWGHLSAYGRLQKQLMTLTRNGFDITLINANSEQQTDKTIEFVENHKVKLELLPIKISRNKVHSFFRLISFWKRAYKDIQKTKPDFIVSYDTPPLMGCYMASKKLKAKLIYDSKELTVGRTKGIERLIYSFVERLSVNKCNTIIQAETNRLDYFKKRYNLPAEKFVLLESLPLKEDSRFKEKNVPAITKVIYLGYIMKGRSYVDVVTAFSQMGDNIQLDIVGGVASDDLLAELKKISKDKTNINFKPPVPFRQIPDLLRNYHIGLVFYEKINLNNFYCAPNKFYDYINNGLPVISYDFPGLVNLIENNKIGVCVKNISSTSMEKAIGEINSNNYYANLKNVQDKFIWENQEDNFIKIFQ